MSKFDCYLLKNIFIATVFVATVLTCVVMLTQSLRFLELVIEAGASSLSFWVLTLLALPRFLEIILPLALMAGILFVYNRMALDSELIVIRSAGASPLDIARSAIVMALLVTVFLYAVTFFIAPYTLSRMQEMRQEVKAQFSTVLFREGVFNQPGEGLTVYVRQRGVDNEMHGIMVYDNREENANPSMVIARSGTLVMDEEGAQVIVYDGARQELDPQRRILQSLKFERYTIELPDSGPVRQRWKEPDERNLIELLNPDMGLERDVESLRDFTVEIHKRFTSPLLALVFTLIVCMFLLIGPVDRRGQSGRIFMAILCVVVLQGLYLASFNIARQSNFGFVLMYAVLVFPALGAGFFLSSFSESVRRNMLYVSKTSRSEAP